MVAVRKRVTSGGRSVAGWLITALIVAAGLPPAAIAQKLAVGSGGAYAGGTAVFSVTLASAPTAAATQNDFSFDNVNTPVAAADGRPDCTVNAGLRKGGYFTFLPNGCRGTTCTGVRAVVIGIQVNNGTPSLNPGPIQGTTLYTCRVSVAAGAAPGIYPLQSLNATASDGAGANVPLTTASGHIAVYQPLPPGGRSCGP
jgi:hypothetical protein